MIKKKFIYILFFILVAFHTNATTGGETGERAIKKINIEKSKIEAAEDYLKTFYNNIGCTTEKPRFEIFRKAMIGFYNLKADNKVNPLNQILTIVDFSLSANKERLWVIDLKESQVLYHTLVAHGRNTGNEFAAKFSNIPNSFMSSIGFYVTGETYHGKHGLSLRLDGMEENYNGNARDRAVVMHGADYVSQAFIKQAGRLGRSLGCPAVPMALHKDIISALANKTCLFIYHPSEDYKTDSQLADESILATLAY